MKLLEYQAKEVFKKYNMPVPEGYVCKNIEEVNESLKNLSFPVVIKAQVPVGGRGKAGGVKLANNDREAIEKAGNILNMSIKSIPVKKVLIAKAVDIKKEFYISIALDRRINKSVIIASKEGGVDIEEIARTNPSAIIKHEIDPFLGLREYEARDIAYSLIEDKIIASEISKIIKSLYEVYIELEAQLAEINPLVIDNHNKVWVVDAKILTDDNALFRKKFLEEYRDMDYENPYEIEAKAYGLSFIKLDGNIGNMVNGAGLAMATMDIIKYYGGEPANFLDVGGSSNPQKTKKALEIILSDKNVKSIFINIFGGITRTDDIANGIIWAYKEIEINVPVVVRLTGTNEEIAKDMLRNSGLNLIIVDSMSEGAKKAVELASK
ncbi:MAG: ADP-forming succinate--CoA ligase subunit beta [candidate division WOR-3 bacterium]|nr:ADP-forming succinate--CoA ligase subunit beta [candidate division WOR-3 bacterium]MCX7948263.1 ADP-forming succinate--CoA ligase subunit beta [candidate division WOR-3 bacterium]MDW8151240.1 ADP-forming succinate--CoA ligase subunit beta [candidate division WOR-3 bacterium]